MKKTGGGLNAGIKNKGLQAIQAVNYQNIAGGLADEMMSFIRPSEPRKCSPPFKMVILDKHGTVVFECNVRKDGKVRPFGLVHWIRSSHFPSIALLPDRAQVARAFLIDRASPSNLSV